MRSAGGQRERCIGGNQCGMRDADGSGCGENHMVKMGSGGAGSGGLSVTFAGLPSVGIGGATRRHGRSVVARVCISTRLVPWRHGLAGRERLVAQRGTRPIASQLYRAVWSVSANMAEGYSRTSGRDRARIFEYALGSTREAAVWYRAGRHVLSGDILDRRSAALAEIRRLLLVMIPVERSKGR
jgi:four helix bundle protein